MTRRQLKRRIRDAWGKYIATLKTLCKERGGKLAGIAAAHDLIGPAANDAYNLFKSEQKQAQNEFGAAIDAKYMAKQAERKARDKVTQAANQAQHDVSYFTEFLAREKIRAKAVMDFAGATKEEADAIIAEAQAKLDTAQTRLEMLS